MTRIDHFNDLHAPKANAIVPAASAIVTNNEGKILLHRRSDSNTWALPGGTMEIGESISDTLKREVKEETGLDIEPKYLVGVYSNPNHVIEYTDGEVRQEFSLCFACDIVGGRLQISNESNEISFFPPPEIDRLNMHPSIRTRIIDYLAHQPQPIIS